MKKILLSAVVLLIFIMQFGCKNSTPTAVATATTIPTPMGGSSALVSIPGATITQTDTNGNSFIHTISAFKMGMYQVTYDLWYTVFTWAVVNGYTFQDAGAEGSNGTVGAAPTTAKYQPVTTVNWRDAIVWCNAYSQKSGLTPVYCSDAGLTTAIKDSTNGAYGSNINTTAGSFDNPYVNWSANGYRLPTEGEYQYAASSLYNHASGAGADYTNATETGLVAWYAANSGIVTHAVGRKLDNFFGIYDMSGNVYEWCWDGYGAYPGTSTDYRGFVSGSPRVLRGGYFYGGANGLQVGDRSYGNPYEVLNANGFRFARTY